MFFSFPSRNSISTIQSPHKSSTSNANASINTTISPLVCCHLEVSSGRWHWMWRGRMRQKEDVLCVCTPWHSFCVPFECSNSNNTRQSTLNPSPPHRSASISIAIASIRRHHHRIVILLSLPLPHHNSTASTTSPTALHREHHVVIDIQIHAAFETVEKGEIGPN